MVKKNDKVPVNISTTAKGGKVKGQEINDQSTSKEVAPGSEIPMSVDEFNVNPSQEGALQSASVTDTDMEVPSAEENVRNVRNAVKALYGTLLRDRGFSFEAVTMSQQGPCTSI